jgi:enoyl-CoA hydratase/carnithine racemase
MPKPRSRQNVTVEHHDKVAVVRFDRKASLNAFDQQTILELTDVARAFQDDLGTQAVVLAGAPNAFSAGTDLQWGALPRLITLVGPARAKRIVLLCEKMGAAQALDWGLVDELADAGGSVEKALELAGIVATMPAATTRMVKQAVNATACALHKASAYADADQSALTRTYQAAVSARAAFAGKSAD